MMSLTASPGVTATIAGNSDGGWTVDPVAGMIALMFAVAFLIVMAYFINKD